MAIAKMAKVMIVTHNTEAAELLETLQREAICQVLNAEQAMVTKDAPDLARPTERPKDIEDQLNRLTKTIAFLKSYAHTPKGLASALAPRAVIDQKLYNQAVSDKSVFSVVRDAASCEAAIEHLKNEIDRLANVLETLHPWQALTTPVDQFDQLERTKCLPGLLPTQQLEQINDQLAELDATIQIVNSANTRIACLIVCLNETLPDVQKLLRSADFEPANFQQITGTIADSIQDHQHQLQQATQQLHAHHDEAASLAKHFLKLQILHDHYANLLNREQTKGSAPGTEQTVLLESWVKEKDFPRLQKALSTFTASTFTRIDTTAGEEIPVEIENPNAIKPFEVITRLYGMPQHFNVDPTVFLAPFFALFFALCLTDAGYGLMMIVAIAILIRKIQGDKKLMWLLGICGVLTVAAGALTGGWFGDAIQQFLPALEPIRQKMIWFDPLENPMMFFKLSLTVGYIQILAGLVIACVHNIRQKDFIAAIFDQVTWLVMLNSLVIFIFVGGKTGGYFGYVAIVPAVLILLFSHREGPLAGRLGMGLYNLFSAIFYMGDVLSYLRLMALGMVTAGMAMAVNIIAKIALDIPYGIGVVLAVLILVGGHVFNMAFSALSAFVHTLRLQFAEFFPKFFVGGGRAFEPLAKQYKYIHVETES